MEQAAARGAEALANFLRQWPEYREVLAPAGRPDGQAAVHRTFVLGTIKSGKSTLINALLGREVMTRGAGVKTFNQIHSTHGDALAAEVQLWPSSVLEARLAFDFRILGAPLEVPENVYEADALAALEGAREAFEAESEADGRLVNLEAGSAYGLLNHALTRLRLTLAGLSALQRRGFRPALGAAPRLSFEETGFSEFLSWTDEASLAPLIAHLSLRVPFPEGLPRSLSLIDCQGSDSLNPLDAADVQAIGQRADTVLYVVQSRLGLREGDRLLLRQLAAQGLADRLIAVLNVEAFEPLEASAFKALRDQVEGDLESCLRQPIPLFAVDALRGLEGAETAALVEAHWARRGAEAETAQEGAGLGALKATLAQRCEATQPPVMARSFEGERAALRALLARDEAVLGLSAEGLGAEQQRRGLKRALDGARRELRATLAQRIENTFSPQGPMAQELDAFLRGGLERYLAERPMPEALADAALGAALIDHALERFNQDWLQERATVREQELGRLRTDLGEAVAAATATLGQELQSFLPRALRASVDQLFN
ncbi:MAG: dynamin family protein, partial [Pseudomonadales bacterium]